MNTMKMREDLLQVGFSCPEGHFAGRNACIINTDVKKLLQRYRYTLILLRQLVITDFKLRYQNSVLGYVWSLLKPLAVFVILYFVFVKFLKVGSEVPHFPVYLLLGIVFWNYFAEVTNIGVSSIVARGDVLRKLNFPKYVIVLAGSFSALINLIINLIIVGIFMYFNHAEPQLKALIVAPLLIGEMFIFSIAMAFLLSALFVRFRDMNYIWEVFMQAAFYATPILYPLASAKEFGYFLIFNPIAQIMQDLRFVLVTKQTATIATLYGNSWVRLIPIAFTLVLVIIAARYFHKRSPYFAEEL